MKFIKKWWFTIVIWLTALFITVCSIVYLFIDDYAFILITNMTSGVLLPAVFLICLGAAQIETKKQTIKVHRYNDEIKKTIEKFEFFGYEVVDMKKIEKIGPLKTKYEIEFVRVRNEK